VQSFDHLPFSLKTLHIPIANEDACVQQKLADSLQKLPRLSNVTFEVPRWDGDDFESEDSKIIWTLPALVSCQVKVGSRSSNYSFLGRLIAPKLTKLDAHVDGESMLQLLRDCPSITSCHGQDNGHLQHEHGLAKLAEQIDKGAWRNLKVLISQRCVLPDSTLLAISRRWTQLKKLSAFLSPDSAISCSRLLLTSLPQLEQLRLEKSGLLSNCAAVDSFEPSSVVQSLLKLQILRLDFADDTTFVGLSFPELKTLHLADFNVRVKDISSVVSCCPKLRVLELRHCPWITTSKAIELPQIHNLVLSDLPCLSDAACGMILSGLPQTSKSRYKIEVDKCPRLSEISLAHLVSLGIRPDELTFVLVRPNTFSALLQPMLLTLINSFHLSNIHLSTMPYEVRNVIKRQFGSRLRYDTRNGDFLHLTEDGQQLRDTFPFIQSRGHLPQR